MALAMVRRLGGIVEPKLFDWVHNVQAWNAMERQVDNSLHYNQFVRLVKHRGWTYSDGSFNKEPAGQPTSGLKHRGRME